MKYLLLPLFFILPGCGLINVSMSEITDYVTKNCDQGLTVKMKETFSENTFAAQCQVTKGSLSEYKSLLDEYEQFLGEESAVEPEGMLKM